VLGERIPCGRRERLHNDTFQQVMDGANLFFYLGHGNGGFGGIRRSNAVTMLFGCSSVNIHRQETHVSGESFCSVYNYLQAGCPAVVGCLWSVEADIEKYATALLQRLPLTKRERHGKSLGEAMFEARSFCRSPYFTGASVVAYGLPIVFDRQS